MVNISVTDNDDSTRHSSSQPKQSKKRGLRLFSMNRKLLITLIVVVVIIGGGAYAYTEYRELKRENARLSANPEEKNKQESQKIKTSLAKLIQIPEEEPTIFNVSDVSKLRSQIFFKSAQNGDKLVVFAQAKKAILYRPSDNRVIEVATVNIGDSRKSPQPHQQNSPLRPAENP